MESVLNRIRDTVSSTVYSVTNNLSTALPGNPLTREYEIIRHVASAGPHLCLKIYDATKKSTKEEAALFVCDKKALDPKFNKKDKEMVLEIIRKGVNQLTRLRHPSLLTVQHNIEESRDSIAFATEPVRHYFCSNSSYVCCVLLICEFGRTSGDRQFGQSFRQSGQLPEPNESTNRGL